MEHIDQMFNNEKNKAKEYNSVDLWDQIWQNEGNDSWRQKALSQVYTRIERLIPRDQYGIDIGGGVGLLAARLKETKNCDIEVWDHSIEALNSAKNKNLQVNFIDLEENNFYINNKNISVCICTEVLEHLSTNVRHNLLSMMSLHSKYAFISVPNNRLGPDEEPQHTCKFTALEFKKCLLKYFNHVRIEVLGPYLLGVCGFEKNFKLSVTLPIRDEEKDIEATIASFMGVADEIVIGIDPRSIDKTKEIVSNYTDIIFNIDNPQGPPNDYMPDGGVHFAWCRNQCIDKCSGDWIFMTEGHERLISGEDVLLNLDKVMPSGAKIGYVLRTGQGQRWGYPWLFRNEQQFRYKRSTHNILDIPEGTGVVKLPQIITLHERHIDRSKQRAQQRKIQNRLDLMDDWIVNHNENSLFYLGQEWREQDESRAIKYLEKFLVTSNNGSAKYQARLMLAKLYVKNDQIKKARDILIYATNDDWSRIEHWIWLGDMSFSINQFEEALQFYKYASTSINKPPFTLWWIDLSMYGYLTAQRLAMCYGELGIIEDSLYWAEKVLELLPDNSPVEALDEARKNITMLKEALENAKLFRCTGSAESAVVN